MLGLALHGGGYMRRREFLGVLGGAAAAWPLAARAQQTANMPRLAVLNPGDGPSSPQITAFRQGLRDLGYVESRNIAIDWRFLESGSGGLVEAAHDLVQRKPDVIVATGGPAVRAVQQATSTIPIIMSFSGDPVGTGLVASLARPGANLTGLSLMSPDLTAKRMELLKEAFPQIRRVATFWNPDDPVYRLEMEQAEIASRSLGIALRPIQIRSRSDIDAAFPDSSNADGLIVFAHVLTTANRDRLIGLANGRRLPAMYGLKEYASDGGLMSYGPSRSELYRRTATYVDKILKGANPANLPVEQPTKFELTINLKTAKALSLTVPPSLLARADEVIE
jgi:putative ABC transport system substrate-binding protein